MLLVWKWAIPVLVFIWILLLVCWFIYEITRTSNTAPANLVVLSHYMIQYTSWGVDPGSYLKEMQMAAEMGIDGFALNCGYDYEKYSDRIEAFFEAAALMSTTKKFVVVLSIDTDSFASQHQDPMPAMARFLDKYKHYSQYGVNEAGYPIVTTFGGDDLPWENFKQLLGYPVELYVNYFRKIHTKAQLNSQAHVDGYFSWPTQEDEGENAQDEYLFNLAKRNNKKFMACKFLLM
jgi:hypothetical protein